jgi:hypothetical protein
MWMAGAARDRMGKRRTVKTWGIILECGRR